MVGQSVAGHAGFNDQLTADGLQRIGLGAYVTTSDFAVDVTENWQSEFLQFFLYIFGTVWLVLRGSPESKELHKIGTESDEQQHLGDHAKKDSPRWAATKDWRQRLYSRSPAVFDGHRGLTPPPRTGPRIGSAVLGAARKSGRLRGAGMGRRLICRSPVRADLPLVGRRGTGV
ncbi:MULTISPECIES: DUF6766 family protein [unclassified Streptomyces]|uniref:DUF6766 family protein n=1 Tax=unclassified Streptomyces TaxID=2593676 RepID=UPI0038125479